MISSESRAGCDLRKVKDRWQKILCAFWGWGLSRGAKDHRRSASICTQAFIGPNWLFYNVIKTLSETAGICGKNTLDRKLLASGLSPSWILICVTLPMLDYRQKSANNHCSSLPLKFTLGTKWAFRNASGDLKHNRYVANKEIRVRYL